MAVTASTMRCPVCDEETLQTLSTPFGTWERCARCFGLFIHEDLIASASADRAACLAALAETKGLLLPTDRACPKCLQPLFDGRVESRGVILSVCPTCQSLWTTLPTLRQFEEAIEKRLAAETEASGASTAGSVEGGPRPSRFYEDTGMASFFRGFARLFDKVADGFRTDPEEKELLKEAKRLKKQKGKKESKPEKVIKAVEPPATQQGGRAPEVWSSTPPPPIKDSPKPTPRIEPIAESPKIEIPQFIFPEGEAVEEKPEPAKEAPKPVEKKPVIGGVGTPKPGFFAKLKAAWSPKPKAAKPPKAAEPPKPKPVEVPKPKPVELPKQVEIPKPASAPKAVKPAPVPKPKKEKAPREPFDFIAVWPPWILAIGGAILSGLRDYGYETEPFILWGMMGWAIGMMIRAKRLYSSPVTLKGQIVLAREEDPKGPLVIKIDDKVYAINTLKRWDVIPRLFGLSNPRQLLKGEVTLTGWYREKLAPSIEVHEIRADKAFRKSMTKALRWIFPVFVFVVALGIYLSLD